MWAVEVSEILDAAISRKNRRALKDISPLIRADLVYLGMCCAMRFLLTEVRKNGPGFLGTDDDATTWIEELWMKGWKGVERFVERQQSPDVQAVPPGTRVALVYRGMLAATDLLATAFQDGRIVFVPHGAADEFVVKVERS